MTRDGYLRAILSLEKQLGAAKRKSASYTIIRLVLFVAALTFVFYLIYVDGKVLLKVLLLAITMVFLVMISLHDRLNGLIQLFQAALKEAKKELAHFEEKGEDGGSLGNEFKNASHPFSNDLDIFGPHSVFQKLFRGYTPSGKHTTAQWLTTHEGTQTILDRQKAIQYLAKDLEKSSLFFGLSSLGNYKSSDLEAFKKWIGSSHGTLLSNVMLVLPFVQVGVSLSIVLCIYYGLLSIVAGILLIFLSAGLMLLKWWKIINVEKKNLILSNRELQSYISLLDSVKEEEQMPAYLNSLYSSLIAKRGAIEKLSKITQRLEASNNILYFVFANGLFLGDLISFYRLEKWRVNYPDAYEAFVDLGELETLQSLAAWDRTHPAWAYPEIAEGKLGFEAIEMGHPLINSKEAVANSFAMEGRGTIVVLTGSNMSGKSTFQRTVCLNLVLAQMGAKVAAKSMITGKLRVFTSMRTSDDLAEHTSSFYAELKRIKQLLDFYQESEEPVFFVLDELLKGTNSQDRHAGAVGLIKQLGEKNGMGIISSHDIELGELAESKSNLINYSFESTIKNEKLVFDYQLRKGVCREANASYLMKMMGIDFLTNPN